MPNNDSSPTTVFPSISEPNKVKPPYSAYCVEDLSPEEFEKMKAELRKLSVNVPINGE
jgi:hypothetical protein